MFVEPPGGWVDVTPPVALLSASSGVLNDNFGNRVDVDGDVIAVGAFRADVEGQADQVRPTCSSGRRPDGLPRPRTRCSWRRTVSSRRFRRRHCRRQRHDPGRQRAVGSAHRLPLRRTTWRLDDHNGDGCAAEVRNEEVFGFGKAIDVNGGIGLVAARFTLDSGDRFTSGRVYVYTPTSRVAAEHRRDGRRAVRRDQRSGTIHIAVDDPDDPPSTLQVTVHSSNRALWSQLTVSGASAARQLFVRNFEEQFGIDMLTSPCPTAPARPAHTCGSR